MDDIEDLLTTTLAERVRAFGTPDGLAEAARHRARQRRRQRWTALTAGLAAVALLSGGPLLLRSLSGAPGPGRAGSAAAQPGGALPTDSTAPGSTLPTGSARQPVSFGPGTLTPPTVPAAAPTAPTGYGRPAAELRYGRLMLIWQPGQQRWLRLSTDTGGTGTAPKDEPFECEIGSGQGAPELVRVAGRSATLRSGPDGRWLAWSAAGGQRWELCADPLLPGDALLTFAGHVRAGTTRIPLPFTLPILPLDLRPDTISAAQLVFKPATSVDPYGFGDAVMVYLEPTAEVSDAGQRHQVTLDGRTGLLYTDGDSHSLWLRIDARYTVVVQVGAELSVTDSDLFTFASAIAPTSTAQVSHG